LILGSPKQDILSKTCIALSGDVVEPEAREADKHSLVEVELSLNCERMNER